MTKTTREDEDGIETPWAEAMQRPTPPKKKPAKRTPQVPALPGCTPLGINPNKLKPLPEQTIKGYNDDPPKKNRAPAIDSSIRILQRIEDEFQIGEEVR